MISNNSESYFTSPEESYFSSSYEMNTTNTTKEEEQEQPNLNYISGVCGEQLIYWQKLEQELVQIVPELVHFIQEMSGNIQYTNLSCSKEKEKKEGNSNLLPPPPVLSPQEIIQLCRIRNNAFVCKSSFQELTSSSAWNIISLPADYIGFSFLNPNKACVVHRIKQYIHFNKMINNENKSDPKEGDNNSSTYFYLDKDPTFELFPNYLMYNFPILGMTLEWFNQQLIYSSFPHLRIYRLVQPTLSDLKHTSTLKLQPCEILTVEEYQTHLNYWHTFLLQCHTVRLKHVDCMFCHVSYLSITAHAFGHKKGKGYEPTEDNVPNVMRSALYEPSIFSPVNNNNNTINNNPPSPSSLNLRAHFRFDRIIQTLFTKCFSPSSYKRNNNTSSSTTNNNIYEQYACIMKQIWQQTLLRYSQFKNDPIILLQCFEQQILETQWNLMILSSSSSSSSSTDPKINSPSLLLEQ